MINSVGREHRRKRGEETSGELAGKTEEKMSKEVKEVKGDFMLYRVQERELKKKKPNI